MEKRKSEYINGYSKLSANEKSDLVASKVHDKDRFLDDLNSHRHANTEYQKLYEELSENVLSNFYLPYSVSPNFLINNTFYFVPMVIEESSVVAAVSSAAKYWAVRGGFHAKVISTIKKGQIHFIWKGDSETIKRLFSEFRIDLLKSVDRLLSNMKSRGGGIVSMEIIDLTFEIPFYYQLDVKFRTGDSMGANFINTVLEKLASGFKRRMEDKLQQYDSFEIVMSILSNHAPESLVEAFAECSIDKMDSGIPAMDSKEFVSKFKLAADIAQKNISRAVTHNKGIYNGIDAVALATGNDIRAVEAQGHAYACNNGRYSSLSSVTVQDNIFQLKLTIPLTIGTVGGITNLHPLAKRSLELLGNPSAEELMKIIACVGLASNFNAVRSLVTKGIQEGHMRMHLSNILRRLGANEEESIQVKQYLSGKKIDHLSVSECLNRIRSGGFLSD